MKFKDIEFRGMSEIYGKDAKIGGVDLSNGTTNPTAELRGFTRSASTRAMMGSSLKVGVIP